MDFKQRVEKELEELEDKVVKLDAFISSSPIFTELKDVDKNLLIQQIKVMKEYSLILKWRLERI